LSLYLIFLAFFVFVPRSDLEDSSKAGWLDSNFPLMRLLHWIVYMSDELAWLLNFLMIIPLAILLGLIFQRWGSAKIILICSTTSLIIEITQRFIPGRVSDYRDVLLNSLGPAVWLLTRKIGNKKGRISS
jgi:glycopeptide antibiotics resistance protein